MDVNYIKIIVANGDHFTINYIKNKLQIKNFGKINKSKLTYSYTICPPLSNYVQNILQIFKNKNYVMRK